MAITKRSDTGTLIADAVSGVQSIAFVTTQPVAGDAVISGGAMSTAGGGAFTPTLADNQGNGNYTLDQNVATSTGVQDRVVIASKFNVASSGTFNCTFDTGAAGSFYGVGGIAFVGVLSAAAQDVGTSNPGTGSITSLATGTTGATAQADEVAVIALCVTNSVDITPIAASGFTLTANSPNGAAHAVGALGFQILTSAGTQSGTFTFAATGGGSSVAAIQTYKGLASAAGSSTPILPPRIGMRGGRGLIPRLFAQPFKAPADASPPPAETKAPILASLARDPIGMTTGTRGLIPRLFAPARPSLPGASSPPSAIDVPAASQITRPIGARTRNAGLIPRLLVPQQTTAVAATVASLNVAVNESIAFADAQTAQVDFSVSLAESVAFTDSQTGSAIFATDRAESIAFTDAQTGTATFAVTEAESVAFTDSQTGQVDFSVARAESIAFTDAQTVTAIFVTDRAESVAFTDTQTASAVFTSQRDESIAFTDAQTGDSSSLTAESIAFTDAQTAQSDFSVALAESVAFTDGQTGNLPPDATKTPPPVIAIISLGTFMNRS